MRLKASKDRCPPLNSVKESFHTFPNATFTSSPSSTLPPAASGGSSFAVVPGKSVLKMLPKSLLTLIHVD
jgi:hypothetical protein